MKVAFDVSGTIEGPKKQLVLKLFKGLQAKGVKCVVWSNSIHYAIDAVRDNVLNDTESMSKKTQGDYNFDESKYFDYAIDDDHSQTWLAAKKFMFVSDLNEESVNNLINQAV